MAIVDQKHISEFATKQIEVHFVIDKMKKVICSLFHYQNLSSPLKVKQATKI